MCEECNREASFTTKIVNEPQLIDSFGRQTSDRIRFSLDNLLTMLRDNPKAKGFIINYSNNKDKTFLRQRKEQIKDQFSRRPIELTSRVFIIDGGYRQSGETELWISFDENQKPVPTPTVDEKFIGVSAAPKKSARRKSK